MQKRFDLEIKRVVDIIFGPRQLWGMTLKDIAKNIPCPHLFHIRPNRLKNLLDRLIRNQALPIKIVFVNVILEAIVDHRSIVTPGVAAKQLVTATTREY